jgi:2-iminobutanoate/2-iminopropanoate deaminase
MLEKQIFHKRALERDFKFCQAVRCDRWVFISGCISWDDTGLVKDPGNWDAQVSNVYTELKETLEHFGLTFSDVVKETVYCRDMEAMLGAAPVRAKIIGDAQPFAATWVEISRLVDRGLLLEVEMTAFGGGAAG